MNKRNVTMSRRQLIKGGALAGAGLFVPWPKLAPRAFAGTQFPLGTAAAPPIQDHPDPPPSVPMFTTPLVAKIPFAKPKYRVKGLVAYYELEMKQHPGFPFYGALLGPASYKAVAPTWGYDDGSGSIFSGGGYIGYLGPTIETRKNEQVIVKWVNHLPGGDGSPFGLLDPTLVPADPALRNYGPLGGRAVVHIHGMHTESRYDGGPENGFNPGESKLYYYPNIQDAASLWYHDHAIGVTRLNAYAGLAALYWIRDSFEDGLNLPKGNYEIPLVIQDKGFYNDAGGNLSLWYPNPWQPESFGNSIVINGQLWPYVEVEPKKYRFRMYNGANARFFNLRLSGAYGEEWTSVPNSVIPFYQIGAEGGLLPRAAELNNILLANGERADVIVDFSKAAGKTLYLTNDAMTPFEPSQPPLVPTDLDPIYEQDLNINVMQLMQIRVKSFPLVVPSNYDMTRRMPSTLRPIAPLNPAKAAAFRQITLVESPDLNHPDLGVDSPATGPYADWTNYFKKVLVNNRVFMPGDGAFNETPKLGTTEVWQFVNITPDTHPMHMHLVTFQVIGRQALVANPAYDPDADPPQPEYMKYLYGVDNGKNGSQQCPTGDLRSGSPYTTGPIMPPLPNESGPKDTVKTNPGEVTYVIAKFEDFAGKFVYHCHILDHEENDMMQYMQTKRGLAKESADEEATVPSEFALDQNFPNPFNPSTQIQFHLPQQSRVTLKIFNIAGQEVATLIDGDLAAGAHAVTWNAGTSASGVYISRIEAGAFSAVRKMILLK